MTSEQMIESLKGTSVSHGTLIASDLFDAFFGTLYAINAMRANQFTMLTTETIQEHERNMDMPEEVFEVLCELEDALNEIAPDGYYFGAHPGDGSDFGFWQVEE